MSLCPAAWGHTVLNLMGKTNVIDNMNESIEYLWQLMFNININVKLSIKNTVSFEMLLI